MGMAAIATFLNNSGYKKKLRQNNTIEGFLHHSSKVCWTIRYIAVSLHLEEEKMRRFREQGMNIIS